MHFAICLLTIYTNWSYDSGQQIVSNIAFFYSKTKKSSNRLAVWTFSCNFVASLFPKRRLSRSGGMGRYI